MKILKKFILVLIIFTMVFQCFACKGPEAEQPPEKPQPKPPIEQTEHNIVKDAQSDYKILIPVSATEEVTFAATELQLIFKKATGILLPVIKDNNYIESLNYISIGKTVVFENSKTKLDGKTLVTSGHILKTIGKNLILTGIVDEGTILSVYTFCENSFGLKIYSENEADIYVNKVVNLPLLKYDEVVLPDITRRSLGYGKAWLDPQLKTTYRLKYVFSDSGYMVNDRGQGMMGHSMLNVMPMDMYYNDHPDWYAGSRKDAQLCYSNAEMKEEFKTRALMIINLDVNKDKNVIMFGMMDNWEYCQCANCKKDVEENFAGSYTGQLLKFINDVTEYTDSEIAKTDPDRYIYYYTFAYLYYTDPPLVKDASGKPVKNSEGKYTPINDSVIPRENVVIYLAILYQDYTFPVGDPRDKGTVTELCEQWKALTNKIFYYGYHANFDMYTLNWDIFRVIGGNYKYFGDSNMFGVYEQSATQTYGTFMEDLRIYMTSQLMWDTSLNADDLAYDFIDHYYKPYAETFKEYYDSVRQWFIFIYKEYGYMSTSNQGSLINEKTWPKKMVDNWSKMFDKMEVELNAQRSSLTESEYELYKGRIDRDRMTCEFLYLEFYSSSFSVDELSYKIDTFEENCEKYRILAWAENAWTKDKILVWRNKIK